MKCKKEYQLPWFGNAEANSWNMPYFQYKRHAEHLGNPNKEYPNPIRIRLVITVKHHQARVQSAVNSIRSKIQNYFASLQASSTYIRVYIYVQIYIHISSVSIIRYFEATDSLPFFTQVQQGLINNRLGKIQFSLSYWASKMKHFTNSLCERRIHSLLLTSYIFSCCPFYDARGNNSIKFSLKAVI